MNIVIIVIIITITYIIFLNYIPSFILKTKKSKIHNNVSQCFITNESDDYISASNNSNIKFIFYFPGINSESLYLHKLCKSLYLNLNQNYNIIVFKYSKYYNSINELSTYLSSVFINYFASFLNNNTNENYSNVTSIINQIKNNKNIQINVIGMSYGCSIAIDCFIKLQYMHDLPPINSFIAYKTFYSIKKAIQHQSNPFISFIIKFIMSSYIKDYYYNNSNIKYIKTFNKYSINHVNDEVINLDAQFNKLFCEKYNINLIYDTSDKSSCTNTYYDYFFGCHSFFNIDIINSILNSDK
jgi:hypothetical protein